MDGKKEVSLLLWLLTLWYVWIIETFLKEQSSLFRSTVILLFIIIYPYTWESQHVTIPFIYLLLCVLGFMLLPAFPPFSRWNVLLSASALSFLFAAVRMAEWIEPVIFLYGQTLTVSICFGFVILLLFDSFKERIAVVLLSICGGDMIYQYHIYPYTRMIEFGEPMIMDVLYYIIAGFVILHMAESILNRWTDKDEKTQSGLPVS